MRRISMAVAVLVALGACSSGGGDDLRASPTTTPTGIIAADAHAPACGDVFVDGREVSDQEWQTGCTDADGSLVVAASYGYDCGTAWSNDLGWGYGGGPFHAGQPLPGLEVLSTCG